MKLLERPIIVIFLLLVLSGYLYFFQIDKIALTDPDETFYAQTAKEMLKKGEWLTPILYGKPQFEKPILFYSFVEASYKIFGINEFAARFPSALFGFIGLIAIYLLGRLLFNNRAGLFSAVVLGTSVEYIILSIGCVTDMMLSTFLLSGILFFFYGQIRKKSYFYILSAAAFALAVLTKGPVFILLPGFTLALYFFIIRDFTIFKKLRTLFWSLAIFVLIALPWYLVMYRLHGSNFINEFFGFQNVTRFLTPEHKTGSQIYYNIPIILGGFMPWSVFLPFGLWYFFKKVFSAARSADDAAQNERNHAIFIVLWLAVIFTFFTASSTKLPTYIFPCFASLALIVGKLWDDFLSMQSEKFLSSGMRYSYFSLLAIVIPALIGVYLFLRVDYPEMIAPAFVTGVFFIFGLALSLTAFIMKKFLAVFFLIAYSIVLIIYPLTVSVLSRIEDYETERSASKMILSMYKEGDLIGGEHDFCAGLAFYTDKLPIHMIDNYTLSGLLSSGNRAWCVLKRKNVVKNMIVTGNFGEKCLVTNRIDKKR